MPGRCPASAGRLCTSTKAGTRFNQHCPLPRCAGWRWSSAGVVFAVKTERSGKLAGVWFCPDKTHFRRQAYFPGMGLASARLEAFAAWSLSPGLWNCSPQDAIIYDSTRTAQTLCFGLGASVRLICSASAVISADSAAGKTALCLCCTARRGVSGKTIFFQYQRCTWNLCSHRARSCTAPHLQGRCVQQLWEFPLMMSAGKREVAFHIQTIMISSTNKRALQEHITVLNTDELRSLKIFKVWNTECTIALTHTNFLCLTLKTTRCLWLMACQKNWVILLEAVANLDLRFLHASLGLANNSLIFWLVLQNSFCSSKGLKNLSWTPSSQKHIFFCEWFQAWSSMIFSLLPPNFSVFLILTAQGCLFYFTASPMKFT